MAFQLIRRILSINNYSGDLKPTLIVEYVCDAQSDLPARSQTNYYVGIGSEATVITDSSKWRMKSDGTWVMYESGTASYTKVEVDALLNAKANKATTLSGYGITNAYTKTQTDNLLNAKANSSDVYTKTQTDNILANKVTISDVFGTTSATIIPAAGVDLDTLTTPGVWISGSTDAAKNSAGRPDYANAASKIFRLEIKNMSSTRVFQEMFVYRIGTYEGDFDRYQRMRRTDGTWNDWQHVETTVVATYRPS